MTQSDYIVGIVVAAGLFGLFGAWYYTQSVAPSFEGAAVTEDSRPRATTTASQVVPSTAPTTTATKAEMSEQPERAAGIVGETDAMPAPVTPPPPVETPAVSPVSPTAIALSECANIRNATAFYADPQAQVIALEEELREAGDTATAAELRQIACYPHTTWLLGDNTTGYTVNKITSVMNAARAAGKIPVFIIYNQPAHDYAGWGSGLSRDEYLAWMRDIEQAIGDASAWVILEPDALATAAKYSETERARRLSELGEAVTILVRGENTQVYIDAGHSKWLATTEAAHMLLDANVEAARGFSLNVANYRTTAEETAYGNAVVAELGFGHFVIDTARNGNGPHPEAEWCNAPGRALGQRPRLVPEQSALDALLWVKPPGESDGTCNGGPTPGKFWLEYALELVANAN